MQPWTESSRSQSKPEIPDILSVSVVSIPDRLPDCRVEAMADV